MPRGKVTKRAVQVNDGGNLWQGEVAHYTDPEEWFVTLRVVNSVVGEPGVRIPLDVFTQLVEKLYPEGESPINVEDVMKEVLAALMIRRKGQSLSENYLREVIQETLFVIESKYGGL